MHDGIRRAEVINSVTRTYESRSNKLGQRLARGKQRPPTNAD